MSWLGLTSYSKGLELQALALAQVQQSSQSVIVLAMEHPPLITLGLRGNLQEDIVTANPGIEVRQTDRGGQATIHSPGQLVIYPVLNIEALGISVRCFVRLLERVTREHLRTYGVAADYIEGQPGLFVKNQKKIMFCGLRIVRGITQHGISINISNDLSLFGNIKACGVQGAQVTSVLMETQKQIVMQEFFEGWNQAFTTELNLLTQGAMSCPAPDFARV